MKYVIIKHRAYAKEHKNEADIVEAIANVDAHKKPENLNGYNEYIEKHGYHFTEALAEHVSKMMINANGQSHHWTASQVKKSMESLGLIVQNKVTAGDLTYAANMAYADFYPDPLKDDAACIKYAYKLANDPDGYEGLIFCRWSADIMAKAIKFDFEKFI